MVIQFFVRVGRVLSAAVLIRIKITNHKNLAIFLQLIRYYYDGGGGVVDVPFDKYKFKKYVGFYVERLRASYKQRRSVWSGIARLTNLYYPLFYDDIRRLLWPII